MTQRIIIENDLVTILEETVVARSTLQDILPHMEHRVPVTLMHPRSAIFTHWNESDPRYKTVKFLCEMTPGIKNLIKLGRRYRLAMPYTYFVYSFSTSGDITGSWSLDDHYVYHTNERVTSMDSRLFTAFLPNVSNDGNICFGSTGVDPGMALPDRVDRLVSDWYLTEFNNDLVGGRSHPFPFNAGIDRMFRPWVDATRELGASAWTTFPEWALRAGEDGVQSRTVREALNLGAEARVLNPATFTEAIPELRAPMTFGRSEEWLRGLTAIQRGRLRVAMENIATDEPDAIDIPTPAPVNNTFEDDGGEPV